MKGTVVLLGAAALVFTLSCRCAAQDTSKPTSETVTRVFEEGRTIVGRKSVALQVLSTDSQNSTRIWPSGNTTPTLALVCQENHFSIMLMDAGIFRTYTYQPRIGDPYEKSDIKYRFERDTGATTSFVEASWVRSPLRDVLVGGDDDFVQLMLKTDTLLLEFDGYGLGGGVARFDLRSLGQHIPKMTLCSKTLAKIVK